MELEVCNGLEAVDAALREKPQLILMDSRLPFIDGLEAIRRIRENERLDQAKFSALMARGPRYHAEALAAGYNDTSKNLLTSKGSEHTWPALNLHDGYLAPLCRISVLSQEVKCQNHDRCYQQ